MHSQFVEFLVVLAVVPSVLVHLLAEVVESVRNKSVRVGCGELSALFLCECYEFGVYCSRNLSALAENHSPHGVVHHDEASLALSECEEVHECYVLDILAERCYEWWIADTWPYVGNLVEEFYEHLVGGIFRLSLALEDGVDRAVDACEVCHHGAHHSAGESASEQQT